MPRKNSSESSWANPDPWTSQAHMHTRTHIHCTQTHAYTLTPYLSLDPVMPSRPHKRGPPCRPGPDLLTFNFFGVHFVVTNFDRLENSTDWAIVEVCLRSARRCRVAYVSDLSFLYGTRGVEFLRASVIATSSRAKIALSDRCAVAVRRAIILSGG